MPSNRKPRLSKHALPRRIFLRGLVSGSAVTVAMPLFEGMLSNDGKALADGSPRPTRFGLWFFGNGTVPDQWGGDNVLGPGWSPRPALAPLSTSATDWARGYVSILRGLSIPDYSGMYAGDPAHNYNHVHHSGAATLLTGDQHLKIANVRDTISSQFRHRTVDQEAAAYFDGQTPLHSVEIGVAGSPATDEGTAFTVVSHNGPGSVNEAIETPRALFDRVFGGLPPTKDVTATRKSILDVVAAQTKRLRARLSPSDRYRMDEHLSSVRTLEQRIDMGLKTCVAPSRPGDLPAVATDAVVTEKNRVFSELLAVILSCDLTRSFSVTFSRCGSPLLMPSIGLTDYHHGVTHSDPGWVPKIAAATVYTMQQLRVLMDVMYRTPDGDGNLLDHVSMLVGSEHGDGHTHDYGVEFPLLIVGKGSGRLKGGVQWFNFGGPWLASHAAFTALRGAGVDVPKWGYGVAEANTPLDGLMV